MQYLAFILNLPWTIVGLVAALLSVPKSFSYNKKPLVFVFRVRSFWWYSWLPGKRYVRAMTNGHIVQLGPLSQKNDIEHELIHVEQAIREPLIHPLLYAIESRKHGYRNNKYEDEAYTKTDSEYKMRDE